MIKIIFFSLLLGGPEILSASAQESTLDLGIGPLSVVGNHYRGSDQSRIWYFPLPYFSYKSEKLEAEPSFIRGIIFHNNWFAFKLSMVPGLNVESRKNRAREGMPSLDYSLEVGPMAIVKLWESESRSLTINFEMPIRESFAISLNSLKPAGMITVPYVNFIYRPRKKNWSFDSEFSLCPMFASEKYHQRFYSVDSMYANDKREAYKAQGGYSGTQFAFVFNKKFHRLGILSFLRWDDLNGAAFLKSPLVKQKHFFISGLGLFWMFD